MEGNQPLVGWAPTPLGPMRLGFGETLKGAPPFAWGASPLPGRRPPSRSHLEGPAPFPLLPINRGVEGGLQHHIQGAAPPLPNSSPPPRELGEALPENCKLHHHAVVLPELFPNFSFPLAGSRRRRRARAICVLNVEAPLFGA